MRNRSRRLIVAIIAVLALLIAGCDRAKEERDAAEDVAEKFATAVSSGEYEKAASYTTSPEQAQADLNLFAGQLQEPEVGYALAETQASVAEGTAQYDVAVKVLGRDVDYKVTASLVTDDEDEWKIDWSPSVIHPKLTSDTHVEIVQAPGNKPVVLDRNGQPVLSEQLVTVVRIDPAAVSDPAGTAQALATALGGVVPTLTAESISTQLGGATEPYTLVALRQEDAAQVQLPELPGVTHNQQARLLSASKSLRSPVLSGLSATWEAASRQATGWSVQIQNQANETVATLLDVPAAPVATIPTTFDSNIQAAAQAAVDQAEGQAVVVALQPSTGGVLAVAQNAAADVEGPIALTGLYPPGSTFKVVSTSAVLAAGAASPDTVLPCPGSATIKGRTIPNDEKFDLGSVPLHTAFANSCNTTIATLAAELPADALTQQALQLGLGVDYLADGMTTITGKVPSAESDAQMVEDSIGQGKVVASPFGMALIAATIANGSTAPPVLVTGTETKADQDPGAPAPEVVAAMQEMMAETVTSGTATALSDIGGVRGKTGTAQFGDGTQSHGWFIGYYQDVAFAVLVVGGGSSQPAVAVTGDFLQAAEGYLPE